MALTDMTQLATVTNVQLSKAAGKQLRSRPRAWQLICSGSMGTLFPAAIARLRKMATRFTSTRVIGHVSLRTIWPLSKLYIRRQLTSDRSRLRAADDRASP